MYQAINVYRQLSIPVSQFEKVRRPWASEAIEGGVLW